MSLCFTLILFICLFVNIQVVSAATANTNVTKGSSCAGVVCKLYGLIPEVQTCRKVRLPVRVEGTAKVRKQLKRLAEHRITRFIKTTVILLNSNGAIMNLLQNLTPRRKKKIFL